MVKPKDIQNFIQGTSNYYLGAPPHIREQAEYRAALCVDCTTHSTNPDNPSQTRCKGCGCSTPALFLAPAKEDSADRWGPMVSATDWELFKSTDIYHNVMHNRSHDLTDPLILSSTANPTYDPATYFTRYFNHSEFDSPDSPGSGAKYMDTAFLTRLALARHMAGIPFRINSGYRTKRHNAFLTEQGYKTAKNSAHLRGHAADISITDSSSRYKIIQALLDAGLTRIGIAPTFIHVDNDPTLPQNQIWTY